MSKCAEDDHDLTDAVRLLMVAGLGPIHQRRLLDRFGQPRDVLSASYPDLVTVRGIGPKLANAIRSAPSRSEGVAEIRRCEAHGVTLVTPAESTYPGQLRTLHDHPQVLFCRGDIKAATRLSVAIVGSRRCTTYGRNQAERFAIELSNAGFTIVSGLARGIDKAAHRGTLRAQGRTIAVTATGLARIYPPEHASLADEIAQDGAIISETRLDQPPIAGLFPQRNRLISGLCLGVIVVEAARGSGALHTARHALDQNREVLVIPGRIDSPASQGCLDLIRDGAVLIRHTDDVLEALGPLAQPTDTSEARVHDARELGLTDQERQILGQIGVDPRHIDELLGSLSLETSRVLATLTVLEMKQLVRRLPGGFFVRPHGVTRLPTETQVR